MTSRFFRKLRLVELVTAVCILAVLSLVLIAQGDDGSSLGSDVAAIHRSAQTAVDSAGTDGSVTHERAS